jgi:hypothetical protein
MHPARDKNFGKGQKRAGERLCNAPFWGNMFFCFPGLPHLYLINKNAAREFF